MAYLKKDILRPDGNPGLGLQARDVIELIDVDDVISFPAPNERGVVIEEDIVLAKDATPTQLYITPGTAELASNADGDIDAVGFTPSLKGKHPGNEIDIREFKTWAINRKLIIIIRYCSGKPADLIGSICNPCRLTANYSGNKDANANELNFAQVSKGSDILIFKGEVRNSNEAS